ncbi:DUF2163 domain-containing protein [Sphingomonas sp.]|uniref:DUF2163 domain-containing protein n=1 Tax=Sphingomonas sp. TaxID=28214 RepID=UPI001DD0FA93|nr:DUF2163 domain-containing protein [Sphingomonas sp.]MBX9796088.1 DUF2163 domain-containing protein [Sphingomonas sp.]
MTDTLTTLALCWRIARRDGVTLGLTDHDRDLVIDGERYRAAPGMTPSAIKRGDALTAETMDVSGALSDAAIRAGDLIDGRWDGAEISLFAVDWAGGDARVALGAGVIGAVALAGTGFTAELKGIAAALEQPVAEETAPHCRAELGDRRCRVAMAGRRRQVRVVAAEDAVLTLDTAEPAANAYGHGLIRWLGGANAGLEGMIAASDGVTVTLRMPPRHPPAPGTLAELVEGCDKTIATCAGRFANARNFRGEPFLPGMDLLTRYPGA